MAADVESDVSLLEAKVLSVDTLDIVALAPTFIEATPVIALPSLIVIPDPCTPLVES
jgi:hypothetical protein